MSRATLRVDEVVLAWLAARKDPAGMLESISAHCLDRDGRLGYMLTGEAVCRMDGGSPDDGIDYVDVTSDGILTGMVRDEDVDPALNWAGGVLSIWNGAHRIPETLTAQIAGRRLGEVVTHRLLPENALIGKTTTEGAWLRMHCMNYSVPIEEARAVLKAMSELNEGKKR